METDPQHLLRDAGLKVTDTRVAVIETLAERSHLDAENLFAALRPRLPRTSLQAMYAVLGALTASGITRRIEPAGSSARYELRVGDNHHHIVCSNCGTIADVDCVHGEARCLVPSSTSGFTVELAEVTFWGLCPACQASAAAS